MDPCDPGTDIKNARLYLHIKMGIPKALVQSASRDDICRAIKRCKKSTGLAMPPMDYDRVGAHRIYYKNPRGINLTGKDYKDLLVGKPSLKVLTRIANKLSIMSNDASSLKGMIINRLKKAKTPEPLMVPIKTARTEFKIPKRVSVTANNLNMNNNLAPASAPASVAAKVASAPLPNTKPELEKQINSVLKTPPSSSIASTISRNMTSPVVRSNMPQIQRAYGNAVKAEDRLRTVIQTPGVSKDELKNAFKKFQKEQEQLIKPLSPLNQLRLQRVQGMLPAATAAPLPVAAPRPVAAPQPVAAVPPPAMVRSMASAVSSQADIKNTEKLLRQKYGNFTSSRNNLMKLAFNNAKGGNKNAIKILNSMNESQRRVITKRIAEAEEAQRKAENKTNQAMMSENNKKAAEEAAKEAAEVAKKSREAIMKIKGLVQMTSARNNQALISATKYVNAANSNNIKSSEILNLLQNVDPAVLQPVLKTYEGTGSKLRRLIGSSSTGNVNKTASNKQKEAAAMNELKKDMSAMGVSNMEVLRRVVEGSLSANNKYRNILTRIDQDKLKEAIKRSYGKGFFSKNDGQKRYLNALLGVSNMEQSELNAAKVEEEKLSNHKEAMNQIKTKLNLTTAGRSYSDTEILKMVIDQAPNVVKSTYGSLLNQVNKKQLNNAIVLKYGGLFTSKATAWKKYSSNLNRKNEKQIESSSKNEQLKTQGEMIQSDENRVAETEKLFNATKLKINSLQTKNESVISNIRKNIEGQGFTNSQKGELTTQLNSKLTSLNNPKSEQPPKNNKGKGLAAPVEAEAEAGSSRRTNLEIQVNTILGREDINSRQKYNEAMTAIQTATNNNNQKGELKRLVIQKIFTPTNAINNNNLNKNFNELQQRYGPTVQLEA